MSADIDGFPQEKDSQLVYLQYTESSQSKYSSDWLLFLLANE